MPEALPAIRFNQGTSVLPLALCLELLAVICISGSPDGAQIRFLIGELYRAGAYLLLVFRYERRELESPAGGFWQTAGGHSFFYNARSKY